MKNIKFVFISLFSTIIISCDNSDYSEAYVDSEDKIDLVAVIETNRTQAVAGTLIDFSVNLPQSFPVEAEVTVRIANTVDGNYKISKVIVPSGTSFVTGSIEMPTNVASPKKYVGTSSSAYIQIDGIALKDASGNTPDPYRMTSNKIYVTLLDGSGAYDFAYPADYDGDGNLEPWLSISLDWEGPWSANDLDLFVDFEDGVNYEDSQSGNRFEGDYFNGNWFPDGTYNVIVSPWRMEPDQVPVRFSATDQHSRTTIVEAVIDKTGGRQIIATITKSGGDTQNITYVISPVN
jgi:hypothetical protein